MMLQKIFKKGKGDIVVINEDKINEVNGLLKEGYSLNKLDKENKLGCSRRAFCNNAKKLGYSFNKEGNKFILLGEREALEVTVKDTSKKSDEDKKIEKPKRSLTLEQLDFRLKKLEKLVLQGNTPVTQVDFSVDEAIITNHVWKYSLDSGPEKWAENIIREMDKFQRSDSYDQIKIAGFDIIETAHSMEKFYIDKGESRK